MKYYVKMNAKCTYCAFEMQNQVHIGINCTTMSQNSFLAISEGSDKYVLTHMLARVRLGCMHISWKRTYHMTSRLGVQ